MQLHHEIDWLAPENIRASGVTVETLEETEEQELYHIKTELVRERLCHLSVEC